MPKNMKVVILAGGFGTRLSEETAVMPKPMVKIGDFPILWHIMKIYSSQGYNDFVVCLGYKGEHIKRYFADFYKDSDDFTVDLAAHKMEFHERKTPQWKITLVDTGYNTMSGGRMKRIGKYIDSDTFMMTYGDGVASVNIKNLIKFHMAHGKKATVTAVKPPPRFGTLAIANNGKVNGFFEKKDQKLINGGFFVLSKSVLDYIDDDSVSFETNTMEKLVKEGELFAYRHAGFWRCMDTLSDKKTLERIWANNPPWKIWKD